MYRIFEKLLKAHDVTAGFVCKETGIAYTTIYSWKNGKYHPKDDKLQAIADFFGVPLDYLKGKQKEFQCPDCHMAYSPIDSKSSKAHEEFHQHFLAVEKHYCVDIPSREECEQRRVDALLILRDIKYDKFRRMSAFNSYAKFDFLICLYENGFELDHDLDSHMKQLAEKLRPDRSISFDLCNAIRAEYDLDEYVHELSANITEKEYALIQRYRALHPEAKKIIDRIFDID